MENGLRTYRPPLERYTFSEEAVEISVKNWVHGVAAGTASRNLLISGPYGTGKTTLAKALFGYLNVSEKDVKVINCGEDGKVETARSLIESLDYAPMNGQYKVIVLDEAHKLTKAAQDAFLTPMESLPKSSLIIACTSNPEVLQGSFRQRFANIQLSKYSPEKILQILQGLPGAQNFPAQLLQHAAVACQGVPRQAIAIVEQYGGTPAEQTNTIFAVEQIVATLPERMIHNLFVQPNYGAAFLLAGYITEENKATIFGKLISYMELAALIKLQQSPVGAPQDIQLMKSCAQNIAVNYWYPQFFRMLTDNPKALRAIITQLMNI